MNWTDCLLASLRKMAQNGARSLADRCPVEQPAVDMIAACLEVWYLIGGGRDRPESFGPTKHTGTTTHESRQSAALEV